MSWVTVAGARPSRRSILLLAVLFAIAALLGRPAAALAEGRIGFTKMVVASCHGGGQWRNGRRPGLGEMVSSLLGELFNRCSWKLSCTVDGTERELVRGAKAGTSEPVAIGKSYPVRQFPAFVRCSLSIDEGAIFTAWQKVAESTLEVPAGGDFSLSLVSIGQVNSANVRVTADSLEMAAPAAEPQGGSTPPPRRWFGVFHSGGEGHAVIVGLEWPAFKARLEALAKAGVLVLHLTTYKEASPAGRRLWSGTFAFNPIDRPQTVVAARPWEDFKTEWSALTAKGQALVDLVTYSEGDKRLFTGVFLRDNELVFYHQYGHTEPLTALEVDLDRPAFLARFTALSGGGLRLYDLTAYNDGKGRVYAGVFDHDVGTYGLWNALPWETLAAKWKEASLGGSEIAQMQSYEENGKRLYDAVLRQSSGTEELVPPLAPAAFAARWRELVGKGMRLIDLETIPEEP